MCGGAAMPRSRTWAALMRRAFDLDVLRCPRCAGRMELVAAAPSPEAHAQAAQAADAVARVSHPEARPPEKEPLPRFAADGPDAERYGARARYPKGDRATYLEVGSLVGSHSHMDEIFESRLVRGALVASRLVRVAEPQITWRWENADLALDDYLARHATTGLLVAQGDTILVERYQYGRTDRQRLISFSISKTVTAMLVGIAVEERAIRSVDDLASAYVPELVSTEYGRTSIRHLLQMSSGYGSARTTEGLTISHDCGKARSG